MRPKTPRRFVSFVFAFFLVAGVAPSALASHEDPAQPNDPLYEAEPGLLPGLPGDLGQWGPRQIRAEQAWHTTTGAGTTIAIVDTGVDLSHEDLQAKVLPGATFLDCGSPGSCGNGDWESGPAARKASKSTHGTHVAGIAAAATNNGKGIAGVAPDAKILPVKVLDEQGATFEDMAAGVRWATNNGADVINMSLGTTLFIGPVGPLPAGILSLLGEVSALDEAVAYAISQGVVVVAAAGNENHPLCAPPAFDPGVLCVMATDSHELPTDYTNLPVKEDQNAVAAPGGGNIDYAFFCGGGVLSTVPAGTGDAAIGETCGYPAANNYDEYNGTSMASPHVAGLAALLAALDCNASEIVSTITGTGRHPVLLRGTYTPLYGYGIVDAEVAAAAAEFGACENVAPVAANDAGSAAPGKLVKIAALANDTDADLDVLKIARFSSPKHGKVARNKDGSLRYRSNAGFRGTDTFRYVAADGRGGKDAALVTVSVGSG